MRHKHPIQPLELDDHGTLRFKQNKIVRYLLDNDGGIDLNEIAFLDFTNDDRQQFAQLIGYSLSGYGDLGYCDESVIEIAERRHQSKEETEDKLRIEYLENELNRTKQAFADACQLIFGIDPLEEYHSNLDNGVEY